MTSLDGLLTRLWRRQRHQPAAPRPAPWPVIYLSRDIVESTASIVASCGSASQPHEGIAYWAGVPTTEAWLITTVLAPDAQTTPGSYTTDVLANAQVINAICEHRLQLLAQVHGHPQGWVGHSDGDDLGAFMPYPGFYSIVVPFYGQRGMLPLPTCGVHRFEGRKFVQLRKEQIQQQFVVVPTIVDLRRKAS